VDHFHQNETVTSRQLVLEEVASLERETAALIAGCLRSFDYMRKVEKGPVDLRAGSQDGTD
jgi:hypothetical protein